MSIRAFLVVLMILLVPGCAEKAAAPPTTVLKLEDIQPVEIEEGDRCPVCGMYVKDYENWASEMFLKDGSVKKFDDPGDLFIYYAKVGGDKVLKIYVRDFYTQEWIDGKEAYYVTRARIHTPMGFGIVPFKEKEKAETFKKDYTAGAILTFEGVLVKKEELGLY